MYLSARFDNWRPSHTYVRLLLLAYAWFWTCIRWQVYLKTYCYIFVLHLLVLGRDKFFTCTYICFKETLFFYFSYKLFNKYFSLSQRTCQFRISVRKQAINSYAHVPHFRNFIMKLGKSLHVYNYRFFWKGLCFSYLISTLSPLHMHKNF